MMAHPLPQLGYKYICLDFLLYAELKTKFLGFHAIPSIRILLVKRTLTRYNNSV